MDHNSQIFVCPPASKHYFKELRGMKSKTANSHIMWLRCAKCTALLEQVVSTRVDKQGNATPMLATFIHVSGARLRLDSRVYRLVHEDSVHYDEPAAEPAPPDAPAMGQNGAIQGQA